MRAEELDNFSEGELLAKANGCFIQAENLDRQLARNDSERLRLLLEAQFYLTAVTRKRDERVARRDFWMEVAVIALIGAEILLSIIFGILAIREGREQAKVLDHMDQSASATADAMKAARDSLKLLADDQAKSLGILQQEQADRARKPKFALYLGNVPIGNATIHLAARGEEEPSVRFDLTLKNEGEAQANDSELHLLVPDGVFINCSVLPPLREYEPSKPGTRGFTYEVPVMPAGKTLRINTEIMAPKGSPPFKVTFTIVTAQLKTVVPMDSLTVLPPK